MNTLKVKSVKKAMLPDFRANSAAEMRFVGYSFDHEKQAFVMSSDVAEIPNTPENRKAVKEGDLKAADKETAELCGVDFKEEKSK